ncbi:hypothetical protein BBB51_03335 [Aggregatibacter aphrophilus]|nr:hypothetical protein BBB51_03335 [Aggregatibacter aphrophilus]
MGVSTHSRPKAAAKNGESEFLGFKFQHTAARKRLHYCYVQKHKKYLFQHTAARKRLLPT